jgi:outer membrane murein-binding lipoprotein Lpp
MKFIILLFLIGCAPTARMDKLEDKINDTRYELKQLRQSVDTLRHNTVWEKY